MDYPIHELSTMFPDMPPGDYLRLKDDIRENGLQQPIALWRGEIIDGRHRLMACKEAGVEPSFYDVEDELGDDVDPRQYVLSANIERRMLTASQCAAIVVQVNEWAPSHRPSSKGGNVATLPATNKDMAEQAKVSERTIRDAKTAERGGLGDDVVAGTMSASEAARIVREDEQRSQVADMPPPPPPADEDMPPDMPDEDLYGAPQPPEPERPVATANRPPVPPRQETETPNPTAPKPTPTAPNVVPVVSDAKRIEELESEVRFLRGEGKGLTTERDKEFQRLRADNATLQASLNTWIAKHQDVENERKWWENRARQLGHKD